MKQETTLVFNTQTPYIKAVQLQNDKLQTIHIDVSDSNYTTQATHKYEYKHRSQSIDYIPIPQIRTQIPGKTKNLE